jgi:hypothetical protein
MYIALDLGVGAEPTSLVVIEAKTWPYLGMRHVETHEMSGTEPIFLAPDRRLARECPPPDYHLRHVERMPAGTSYPTCASRMKELFSGLTDPAPDPVLVPVVAIDATGVGSATTDLFTDVGIEPYLVTVTGGDEVIQEGWRYKVPKRELISTAQVMLQTSRLKIARDLPLGELLVRELQRFRMTIDLRKADQVVAWREGANDDLVLALATGLWIATKHDGIPRGMTLLKRIRRPLWAF